jgi:hypothetical protein
MDTNPANVDDPTNWHGGFYELGIELGPRDDARLEKAVATLWRTAKATGPFGLSDDGTYQPADPSVSALEQYAHLRGVVEAPHFGRIVVGALAVRFEGGDDWLSLYLPMGALGKADASVGGYPFDAFETANIWRPPLDEWLASIGTAVYATVRFERAAIGYEALGEEDSDLDGHLVPAGDSVTYVPAPPEVASSASFGDPW